MGQEYKRRSVPLDITDDNNHIKSKMLDCPNCGARIFADDVIEAAAFYQISGKSVPCNYCGCKVPYVVEISWNDETITLKISRRAGENPGQLHDDVVSVE
jgi:DNA-directed RNA polymerase subunit RPC12/RpoP